MKYIWWALRNEYSRCVVGKKCPCHSKSHRTYDSSP